MDKKTNASLKSDTILQQEQFQKHEKDKWKPCPHCDYRRPYLGEMQIHIDRRHPEHGEKQFFCDVCGKGFIFKASLKDHPEYYCPKNPKFKGRKKKTDIQLQDSKPQS